MMKLSDYMVADAVVPELAVATRDEAIHALVTALATAGKIEQSSVDGIVEKIIERENMGSTGIGKGIAVPHIKHSSVKDIVGTIGCSQVGIDFKSLDQAPVYTVLLLVSPESDPDKHLEAMENLFSHLSQDSFRKFLRQAHTQNDIVEIIKDSDPG